MKTLHLDSGREMRGGQWQVLALAKGLRERGHEVRLLVRGDGALRARAGAEQIATAPLNLWSLLAASRWADIIHAHDARTHTLAAIALRRRFVVSRRVAFAVRKGVLSRWKYARAAHYLAVSEYVASKLKAAGIKSEAVTVVYDGVALGQAGSCSGHRVVAPDTADPMKGSGLLRQSAKLAGAELCFSGDLSRDLQNARVFAYITFEEGLGSATLLAMANGVPVVASHVGGVPEAVEDGGTGILVENRPEEIARALRLLLDDHETATRMGSAGRARVEKMFTIDKMVEDTVDVYRKVLR